MYECRKRPSADAERDLGVLYPAHNLPGGNLRLRNSERAHRGQDHGRRGHIVSVVNSVEKQRIIGLQVGRVRIGSSTQILYFD